MLPARIFGIASSASYFQPATTESKPSGCTRAAAVQESILCIGMWVACARIAIWSHGSQRWLRKPVPGRVKAGCAGRTLPATSADGVIGLKDCDKAGLKMSRQMRPHGPSAHPARAAYRTCVPMRPRSLIALLIATLLLGICPRVSAQADAVTYPARMIRLIVPFYPGAGSDAVARLVAQKLSQSLPASVIVENLPGAGGAIGAREA